MIKMNAVDIVQPDICYIGGLTRALRVAKMAEKANKLCVPHSANLAMVTVFTLHMLAAIPNAGPYIEFAIEPWPWQNGIYSPQLKVKDGLLPIPPGPAPNNQNCITLTAGTRKTTYKKRLQAAGSQPFNL
jgi:L-alanine-DL-glutamate epimerase-like enolase superfamily enzyme